MERGTRVAIGLDQFEVEDASNESEIILRPVGGGEPYRLDSLDESQLSQVVLIGEQCPSGKLAPRDGMITASLVRVEEAARRLRVIRPLLGLKSRTLSDVKEVAAREHMAWRTIYEWMEDFVRGGPNGLLPSARQAVKGRHKLDVRVEAILSKTIQEEYKDKQRVTPFQVYLDAKAACRDAGLKGLSPPTVYRRILEQDGREATLARLGKKALESKYGFGTGEFRDKCYPLQTIMVDDHLLDIRLVTKKGGEVVGRPYLTLAIDVYSRCVWGYYLGFSTPSDDTVGLTVVMGVTKKDFYVREFGLSEWPTYGVPAQIHTDNGKNFRSDLMVRGCLLHGISLERRPLKTPRYGSYIERIFKTMEKQLIHALPGTTFSSVSEKGEYDPDKEACLTIDDLEPLLLKYIVEQYHNTVHSALGMTPLAKWREGLQKLGVEPREPENPARFRLDFLSPVEPDGRRMIQRDGVHYRDLVYCSPILYELPRYEVDNRTSRRYLVRYDPANMRYVYIYDDRTDKYHELTARESPAKFGLRELEATKAALKRKGLDHASEELVTKSILERRAWLKARTEESGRARREVAAAEREEEVHSRNGAPNEARKEPATEGEEAQQDLGPFDVEMNLVEGEE